MNDKQRLKKLKKFQIGKHKGRFFNSIDKWSEWIDNVTPLLRNNDDYYKKFCANSMVIKFSPALSEKIEPNLNVLVEIVNNAIAELEKNIDPAPNDNIGGSTHHWYQKPIGIIGIGVITVILGAFAIWIINHYFSLNL